MSTSGGTSGGGSGLPYQTFSGSPVGVVTPTAAGYVGLATDTFALYYAAAATSADWVQVSGAIDDTAAGFSALAAGPVVVNDEGGGGAYLTSNGGAVQIETDAGATVEATGTQVIITGGGAGSVEIGGTGDELTFFGNTAVAMTTITGMLSAVVDPNAQAVLTAIVAALATAAGYGLVTDSTT